MNAGMKPVLNSVLIPVSVIVMTRNEAANISSCLECLERFEQVFVIDSESTDGTGEIARTAGAEVIAFRWDGRYPKKKQWCLDNLTFRHEWVLYVDADERVTPELADEIARLMAQGPKAAGYFIEGRPVFMGVRLRFGARNRKLALLDRRRARFDPCPDLDVATMWEVEGHYQPCLDGPAGRLRRHLWHADDKPSYAWFERHNRYSDWEAALCLDGRLSRLTGRETGARRWLKRIFARMPMRPAVVFLHSYVWCLGLLDGRPGFDHAMARAFYYWQIGVKIRTLGLAAQRHHEGVQRLSRPRLPIPWRRRPGP
jgi:glycosyltransferase involved in cell wall biosynthesis